MAERPLFIEYVPKTFKGERLATVNRVNEILESYAAAGYDLTLRQVYYQFVARGWIPNRDTEYKRLGSPASSPGTGSSTGRGTSAGSTTSTTSSRPSRRPPATSRSTSGTTSRRGSRSGSRRTPSSA